MGLLWLTMVTSFPAVLAGFEWYRQGISFNQIIFCAVISLVLLLAYSIPACELGARSGLGYCALSQNVFGRRGAVFSTINLLWLFTVWYGLTAVFMAQAVSGLFHWQTKIAWLSVFFALLMSFNNLFGFSGVANFARFMAGPILTIWVGTIFFKALHTSDLPVIPQPTHPSDLYALTTISSFIIGFAVWGNEQDYWRFSKPGIWRSAIPLIISIGVGQIMFPVAGWLIARMTGLSDSIDSTAFMSSYCFGSISVIGLLIFTADYFSTNDSSLFGCASAIESIYPLNHNLAVSIFAIAGAVVAALISLGDATKALTAMVSLNCIILPTPTIIMITEWWLRSKIFCIREKTSSLTETSDPPLIHWPATIALICGLVVGIVTSGLIPAFEFCHIGICSLQAWLTSIIVYVPLRINEYTRETRSSTESKIEINEVY
jgi:purine-cytosine permease-like protein